MSYNNRILKFQSGGKYFAKDLKKAGNRAFGQPLYYDKRTGDLIQIASEDALTRDGWSKGEVVRTGNQMRTQPYSVYNIFGWQVIDPYKGTSQVRQKQSNGIEVNGKKYASVSDWRKERIAGQQPVATNAVTTKTSRTGRTGKSAVKVIPKGQAYWDSQYQDFKDKMTADQKAWLDQKGIDYSSAEQLQGYLSRINKNIDQSFVDNKWGKNSQAAWENFVNTTMKNNPLQTPVEESEPIVDAPDPFGYKTSNTYEDNNFVDKVKALGIRSNADLMHFMYESKKPNWKGDAWQTQFRNDVDRLLGGDYSDANIRKVFKTKNGWSNGFMGRGDFGDFQNVLQTNAGVWNGMYDAKEQASRTGTSGIVYSSPEMMRKFESIKLQPNQNNQGLTSNTKFDFSNMKFNNIFTGNTGATTLGNIPSTNPINLSQEFTKGLTPNIPSEVYKPNTSVVYKLGTSDWLDWAQ